MKFAWWKWVWWSVVASELWRRGGRKDIIIFRRRCCVVCVKNRIRPNTILRFGDFILFIYRVWTNTRITDTCCNRMVCTYNFQWLEFRSYPWCEKFLKKESKHSPAWQSGHQYIESLLLPLFWHTTHHFWGLAFLPVAGIFSVKCLLVKCCGSGLTEGLPIWWDCTHHA
jgi:hypothetical protein